ncbi:hypothetical protein R3P38DRAFT_3174579 [Favolaschia claudopus]|uniref:Transmembrane protein n=1 Tax=Favolaschia claudopus TaxID=2862362 RepID=A0AAW0D6A2_9AGAR
MSSPSPSSLPSPSSTPLPKDPNSNLYLFTFLATLLLLFTVSCAIVSRACYVRHRFRRNLRRAMDQGLVLAPQDQGLKFIAPPKLFDVFLDDKHPTASESWASITPISVQPVPANGELYLDDWSNESKATLSTVRSKSSIASSTETLQVSVFVAMPKPPVEPVNNDDEPYLPEVVLGFTQAQQPS